MTAARDSSRYEKNGPDSKGVPDPRCRSLLRMLFRTPGAREARPPVTQQR